jgi:hypothetical protein
VLARKPLRASSGCCAPSPLILTAHSIPRNAGFRSLERRGSSPSSPFSHAKRVTSGCCGRSRTCLCRSLRSLYCPRPPRLRPGSCVQSSLPFIWGKALAFSASDNGAIIRSGLKGTRLAIKKIRKPCALQTPLGSLDITNIMSPCLLSAMFDALCIGPAGSHASLWLACPSAPRGSPEERQ